MAVFEFADKLEAMQWVLDTQKGRRNVDKWELGKIALKLKPGPGIISPCVAVIEKLMRMSSFYIFSARINGG